MKYEVSPLAEWSAPAVTVADVHHTPESKIVIPATSPLFETVLNLINTYQEKSNVT